MGMGMTVLPRYYRGNGIRLHHGNGGDGDSSHGSGDGAYDRCVTHTWTDGLQNITEHLLTENELFFSHLHILS